MADHRWRRNIRDGCGNKGGAAAPGIADRRYQAIDVSHGDQGRPGGQVHLAVVGVLGYLVNSGGNSHEVVSLERQPRTELLRCEPNRVLAMPQREDRPVPNCHPDPNDFPEPHPTTTLGSLWYRRAK